MNDFFPSSWKITKINRFIENSVRGLERFSEQCLRLQVSIPSGPEVGELYIGDRFFRTISVAIYEILILDNWDVS